MTMAGLWCNKIRDANFPAIFHYSENRGMAISYFLGIGETKSFSPGFRGISKICFSLKRTIINERFLNTMNTQNMTRDFSCLHVFKSLY